MITVSEQTIKEIPCLVVAKDNLQEAPLQTVIYYHGITSAKEHTLPLAFLLARSNSRIALPDSSPHGDREERGKAKDSPRACGDGDTGQMEGMNLIRAHA